jgi:3-oxoacyl-[acyl-carrier-protein] synthase II
VSAEVTSDVVVTGIGVFSSIGTSRESFWEALVAGTSGIGPIQAFDASNHKSQMASEVIGFRPKDYLDRTQMRRMARFSQLATCASVEAVKDAHLDLDKADRLRIGCVIGSAAGDHDGSEELYGKFKEKGPGSVHPLTVPRIIPNMPACNAAMELGIHGPNLGVSTACATGASAIGMAMGLLRAGRADVILAGGAESTITPVVVDSYASMRVLSNRNDAPQEASRPFDADRDGFVIGEGAGVLVLETAEHAKARGAEPLAVLKGCGMTSDAFNVALPEPNGTWAAAAMREALRDAGMHHDRIGYINAHGTSTKVNDAIETLAIRSVFGDRRVPVSSNKSMIGHTLGAAGAIEAAATVLSIHHQIAPPTINYQTPDPECDLDVVPNEAREVKMEAAMTNAFGFGGQNAVLVFGRS